MSSDVLPVVAHVHSSFLYVAQSLSVLLHYTDVPQVAYSFLSSWPFGLVMDHFLMAVSDHQLVDNLYIHVFVILTFSRLLLLIEFHHTKGFFCVCVFFKQPFTHLEKKRKNAI